MDIPIFTTRSSTPRTFVQSAVTNLAVKMEYMTIDGLRKLKAMKEKDEPLPKEWEEAAMNWRMIKFRNNERLKNELARMEAQYSEGVIIIDFLRK